MRFSANLGFLWTELPLPDAIRAAKAAGFDAVECHWPYDTAPEHVAAVLSETGLPMLGLNTRRGDVSAGENGLSALPGRVAEARAALDEAVGYAAAIGARNVHVMAGCSSGATAHATFVDLLRVACAAAASHDVELLIEPLNPFDAPGYFLRDTVQAIEILQEIGDPRLRLMFDCYHVARTEGDVRARLRAVLPWIGHIQFASVPDRGPPDGGDLDYGDLFREIEQLGYEGPLGAEYKPNGPTEPTLRWLSDQRTGPRP